MATVHHETAGVEVEVVPLFAEPTPEDSHWWSALDGESEPAVALAEPTLPFPEWVAGQASYYRSLGSTAGDWLAALLDGEAGRAGLVGATSPDQLLGRAAELERSRDDTIYRAGVRRGTTEAGRGDLARSVDERYVMV